MNVREVLEFAKKHRVQMVDLKFVDLPGVWQHMTIPVSELTEDLFKDGSGLDGSSIRGWKAINNSDLLIGAGSCNGLLGSVYRGADTQLDRQCRGSDFSRKLRT